MQQFIKLAMKFSISQYTHADSCADSRVDSRAISRAIFLSMRIGPPVFWEDLLLYNCHQYNSHVGAPLSVEGTPRPASPEEVWRHATEERFEAYQVDMFANH